MLLSHRHDIPVVDDPEVSWSGRWWIVHVPSSPGAMVRIEIVVRFQRRDILLSKCLANLASDRLERTTSMNSLAGFSLGPCIVELDPGSGRTSGSDDDLFPEIRNALVRHQTG